MAASAFSCQSATPPADTGDPSGDPPATTITGAPDPAESPDGWAGSAGAPAKPGGYGAAAARVHRVSTRSQLIAALAFSNATTRDLPKIIYIEGMIDLCVDANDLSLGPEAFIAQTAGLSRSYADYPAYRAAYAASCATGVAASLEGDRQKLASKQKAVVVVKVGGNTSLLGVGAASGFKNGSLMIDARTNVVLRNLSILDAYDYFPSWDQGENLVNSEYDAVSITNASTYVWVDHCTLGDGDRPDSSLPHITVSGADKKWVTHDGLIDVTNGSNYVTLSWNKLVDHDKTLLFGSSDGAASTDANAIKVTVHHNYFDGTAQRLPRVRFGQVHVYNNYYVNISGYAVGVGDKARIYSEANYFDGVAKAFAAYDDAANEGYYCDTGSFGLSGIAADTAALVGWKPSDYYSYSPESASAAKAGVMAGAGTGRF
jgi:pectate lyase